jgi:hypothetical protein
MPTSKYELLIFFPKLKTLYEEGRGNTDGIRPSNML